MDKVPQTVIDYNDSLFFLTHSWCLHVMSKVNGVMEGEKHACRYELRLASP